MPTINPTTEDILENLDFSCEAMRPSAPAGRMVRGDRVKIVRPTAKGPRVVFAGPRSVAEGIKDARLGEWIEEVAA